jgi:hypothetical protein
MSSPKFERAKRNNPGLAVLLDGLGRYILAQTQAGQTFIVPKLAAVALRLNDGEAFVLLELLARVEVLERVYNIYCRQSEALIQTVESLEPLDDDSYCDFCGGNHDISQLRVEVAFRVRNGESLDMAA